MTKRINISYLTVSMSYVFMSNVAERLYRMASRERPDGTEESVGLAGAGGSSSKMVYSHGC